MKDKNNVRDKLNCMLADDKKCSNIGIAIYTSIIEEEISFEELGRQIISAYLEFDVDAMLIAVCGSSIRTLID